MSGHSKWHSIKHKKAATDAKKGKIFTKHAKLIAIAARNGADPTLNASLQLAIDNAKADNTPNDNITRAIKKGSGEEKGAAQIEEITYEAYAPGGVALMIECLTDNKNRTHSNLHTVCGKKGGNLASSGSVAWMFEKKGVIEVEKNKSTDEIELIAIDSGADDIDMEEETVTIYTKVEDFIAVKNNLIKNGLKVASSSLKQVPKETNTIDDSETAQKIINLIEAIEEDDDVSEVYSNFELGEGVDLE